MITIHQRYRQTDRQTDRQTTCDRNTALCTEVHRAVKTKRLSAGDTRDLAEALRRNYMQRTSGKSPNKEYIRRLIPRRSRCEKQPFSVNPFTVSCLSVSTQLHPCCHGEPPTPSADRSLLQNNPHSILRIYLRYVLRQLSSCVWPCGVY